MFSPVKLLDEKLAVGVYEYPSAEKNNSILYKYILSLSKEKTNNTGAVYSTHITNRNLYEHKEVQPLLKWIFQILEKDFILSNNTRSYQLSNNHYNLKCVEMWGIIYKKDEGITPHTHHPHTYSFSYYVNAPKGSSPLVFPTSGHKIKPKTGQLVICESRLLHEVPKAKVDDRCIIAGCFSVV
jgi:hypothetical protein